MRFEITEVHVVDIPDSEVEEMRTRWRRSRTMRTGSSRPTSARRGARRRPALAASCEPGYNLPDGCTDAAIDRHFGEGKPTCAECKRMVECCCDYGICEVEFDRAYAEEFGTGDAENSSFGAMWALEWIPNHMRDMQEAACETFESY